MIVVTYWTNNQYRVLAGRLGDSARDLGLGFEAFERPHLSTWTANVNQKPDVIIGALEKHREPVLYVDADAEIVRLPVLLAMVDRVGAAHFAETGKPAGGTLYFRPEAMPLLRLWAKLVSAAPDRSDDFHNLHQALATAKQRLTHLPPAYCWHERNMRPRYPGAVPVIVHQCVGEHNYRNAP